MINDISSNRYGHSVGWCTGHTKRVLSGHQVGSQETRRVEMLGLTAVGLCFGVWTWPWYMNLRVVLLA